MRPVSDHRTTSINETSVTSAVKPTLLGAAVHNLPKVKLTVIKKSALKAGFACH